MNDETISLQRASRHSHTVNPCVRNGDCYNLRTKCWEIRKTDCLQLNLFTTQQAFAQIAQGKAKPKPRERSAWFNFNFYASL